MERLNTQIRISQVTNDTGYFQKLLSIDSQTIKQSIAMSNFEGSIHNLQESQGKTIKPNDPLKLMPNHNNSIIDDQKVLLDQLENHLKLFRPSINHQLITKMKQVYEQSMARVQQTNTISSSEVFSSKQQAESRSQEIFRSSKQGRLFQPQQSDGFLSERNIDSIQCENTERRVKYFSRKTIKKRSAVKIMPKSNIHASLHIVQAKKLASDQIYEQNFAYNCLKRLRQWREMFQGQNMSQCEQSDNKEVSKYWNYHQKKLKEIIAWQKLGPDFQIHESLQQSLTVRKYKQGKR